MAKDKKPGINQRITIKGVTATAAQVRQVERVLTVADKENAPERAILMALCAGIGESSFTAVVNSIGYGGVFQGAVSTTGTNYFEVDDTEEEAHYFFQGGKGFQGGGAIALSKTSIGIGDAVTKIEGSDQPGSFYLGLPGRPTLFIDEARAILKAWGGARASSSSRTGTREKEYNFEVGTSDNPRETYWDAANRLADEVNWPLFIDGNDVFYDSEMTLIRQKPAAEIHRDDDRLLDWNFDWDHRHIATEMTLTLLCEPFEFRAGEVFVLNGFGPASTGSTAGPDCAGRWLISDINRSGLAQPASNFTLKQPERPDPEPANERVAIKESGKTNGVPNDFDLRTLTGTPKQVIDKYVVPLAAEILGIDITPASVEAANHSHTHLGSASDHAGPPSFKWAADMSNGTHPTKGMDKLSKVLAAMFQIPWPDAIYDYSSGQGIGIQSANHAGYRFQLIYRYNDPQAGDHFNHVHFGVRVDGSTPTHQTGPAIAVPS